jgi:hypothetical protein
MRIEFDRYLNMGIIVYCKVIMVGAKLCTAPSYHRDSPKVDLRRTSWSRMSGSVKS